MHCGDGRRRAAGRAAPRASRSHRPPGRRATRAPSRRRARRRVAWRRRRRRAADRAARRRGAGRSAAITGCRRSSRRGRSRGSTASISCTAGDSNATTPHSRASGRRVLRPDPHDRERVPEHRLREEVRPAEDRRARRGRDPVADAPGHERQLAGVELEGLPSVDFEEGGAAGDDVEASACRETAASRASPPRTPRSTSRTRRASAPGTARRSADRRATTASASSSVLRTIYQDFSY